MFRKLINSIFARGKCLGCGATLQAGLYECSDCHGKRQ